MIAFSTAFTSVGVADPPARFAIEEALVFLTTFAASQLTAAPMAWLANVVQALFAGADSLSAWSSDFFCSAVCAAWISCTVRALSLSIPIAAYTESISIPICIMVFCSTQFLNS
ncbi:hypothetical protein D3C72_1444790 [compost metagenome]